MNERTFLAVVSRVASRANAALLIGRALSLVHAVSCIADASRTRSSVGVHDPTRFTLAPEGYKITPNIFFEGKTNNSF